MDRYELYYRLNTNTATNVICNELFDEVADNPTDDMINAIVIVLFHSQGPDRPAMFRNEIRERVEAVLNL